MTSKTYVFKVVHLSEDLTRTERVVRGAAGAWQAIDWVEQQLGQGLRCTAINLTRLNDIAPGVVPAATLKGGA